MKSFIGILSVLILCLSLSLLQVALLQSVKLTCYVSTTQRKLSVFVRNWNPVLWTTSVCIDRQKTCLQQHFAIPVGTVYCLVICFVPSEMMFKLHQVKSFKIVLPQHCMQMVLQNVQWEWHLSFKFETDEWKSSPHEDRYSHSGGIQTVTSCFIWRCYNLWACQYHIAGLNPIKELKPHSTMKCSAHFSCSIEYIKTLRS